MSTIDQRGRVQILEDAICKARVLRGIALLEEKHGPDWADKIDLDRLDLSESRLCVLGQAYHGAKVSDEALQGWTLTRGQRFVGDDLRIAREYMDEVDGYERGLAILDGPLLEPDGPETHGFDYDSFGLYELDELPDERLKEEGITREMVESARREFAESAGDGSVRVDYSSLQMVWEDEIRQRQALTGPVGAEQSAMTRQMRNQGYADGHSGRKTPRKPSSVEYMQSFKRGCEARAAENTR